MATGVIPTLLDKPVTVNGINGTVENVSVIQEGKLVSGYISISSLTLDASSWANLMRISAPPNTACLAHAYLGSNGSDCAIIRFMTDGLVHIFPTKSLSNNAINFMFTYRTA